MQYCPNVRWLADKGTSLEFSCLGGEPIFDSGPLINARDGSNFVAVGEGGEYKGGARVNDRGLMFDVETIVFNIIGNFSCLPFDPINNFHCIR